MPSQERAHHRATCGLEGLSGAELAQAADAAAEGSHPGGVAALPCASATPAPYTPGLLPSCEPPDATDLALGLALSASHSGAVAAQADAEAEEIAMAQAISASVAEGTAATAQGGGGGGGAAGSSGSLGPVESYGRQATAAERLGQRELEQQQQQQQKGEDSRMQAPHASARRALAEERSRKAPSGLRRAREEEDCAREAKRWASLATRLKLLVVVHREVQPLTLHYLLDKVPPDPRPRYVLAPHPNPSQVDQPRTLQES